MKNTTFYKFDIMPDQELRLDQLISLQLPEYSRSRIKNWINQEKILVNGEKCAPKDKVLTKSSVQVEVNDAEELDIQAENLSLNIVYEDTEFIIVNKDENIVTHTAVGNYSGTIQNGLLFKYPELRNVPRSGIIHRLDKQTSGLLIISRNLRSHNNLSKQIQDRLVEKKYDAVVSGVIDNINIIDDKIGRHKINRKKMAVTDSGKKALSKVKIKERYKKATLIEVELVTGRTHQIRVHLSHQGYPIIGDKLYGFKKNKFSYNQDIVHFLGSYQSFALHARFLKFKHPKTNKEFKIDCLPPYSFNVIKSLVSK